MSSITRIEEQNAQLRARLQRNNRTQQEQGERLRSMATKLVSAYSFKGFDLEGKLSIAGFGGLEVAAIGGFLAGEFLDGDLAKVASDIGEAAAIVKAYQMGEDSAGGSSPAA